MFVELENDMKWFYKKDLQGSWEKFSKDVKVPKAITTFNFLTGENFAITSLAVDWMNVVGLDRLTLNFTGCHLGLYIWLQNASSFVFCLQRKKYRFMW